MSEYRILVVDDEEDLCEILKFNLENDPFNPEGCIELQEFVRPFGILDKSLQKIYALLFKHKISKSQQLSNWESDVLSDGQKQYAAMDAWACLSIYTLLNELSRTGDFEIAPLKEEVNNNSK